MAAPSSVFTINRVAEMLGEDEEWLQETRIRDGTGRRMPYRLGQRRSVDDVVHARRR
jgi:hypothetical protein